jgi:uroporphyrinogen decarboxylase
MNPVANFLNLLRFQPTDYVPCEPPLYELSYYGANHEGWDNPLSHDSPLGAKWIDIWGVGWHKLQPGVMAMPEHNPLAEPHSLAGYRWPSPDEERIHAQVYRLSARYHAECDPGEHLLAASHRDTLWEKAYMLVGMENMMIYFKSEPDYAREILRRIMDFQLGMARHYMQLGVRFASLGDDLGAQQGALLGPRIVRDFLVPEYRRLFQFYKDHNVLIGFHCCGNLDTVLDVFFELGVDILNPVQASANNLEQVRARTLGRLALQGGVDSGVIMDGPPERIEALVRQRIGQLGQGGGYICCPDQGMPYPPAHLDAVRAAVELWGRYPLTLTG